MSQELIEKINYLNETNIIMVNDFIKRISHDDSSQYWNYENEKWKTSDDVDDVNSSEFYGDNEFESESEFEREQTPFSYDTTISINDYLLMNDIDEQYFFSLFNEMMYMKCAPIRGRDKGLYCCACFLHNSICDCEFMCGLSRPIQDVNGNCQFKKCKWRMNDVNDVSHKCEGVYNFRNNSLYKFMTQDSCSCVEFDVNEFLK